MGVHRIENLQDTVNRLLGKRGSAAVSPEGPYVVGKLV
jgi:hypothetical protein